MTRINLVEPRELCDKHLIAELHELIRIPNGLLSGKLKITYPDIPDKFTLGEGHVKFFTNKLTFLYARYLLLLHEAKVRGFNVKDHFPKRAILDIPLGNWKEYLPTENEIKVSRSRIIEMLPANARWTNVTS